MSESNNASDGAGAFTSALDAARDAVCLTKDVRDERQFVQQVQQLLTPIAGMIASSSAASVTYRRDNGAPRTVAATNLRATMIDSLQYEVSEGSCLEAIETAPAEPLVMADLQDGGRWPQFAAQVARASAEAAPADAPAFRSLVSCPVVLPEGHRASLNVYHVEQITCVAARRRSAGLFSSGPIPGRYLHLTT